MKNLLTKIGGFTICISLLFASCETVDFGDENVNPNSPTNKKTDAMITSAITAIPGIVGAVDPTYYVQQISDVTYTTGSRYSDEQWSFDGFYTGALKDLQEVIDLNTKFPTEVTGGGSNANQIAVAHILMGYMYHNITDRWGAIPMSEALQGVDKIYPKFDLQEDVYSQVMTNLDKAVGMIDGGGLNGDIMFNGDMNKWKMFANTLKMRMALRMADVNPSAAQSAFVAAWNAGVISSNAESVHYPYLTEDAHDNPWQDRFETRYDFVPSALLIDHLKNNLDPRLAEFADGSLISNGTEYVGLEYGLENPGILETNLSGIDARVIKDGTNDGGFLMTYAEVCFAMSEAFLRGWNGLPGSAQLWYEYGIAASHGQWGVASSDASAYLASVAPVSMEAMAMEKWVALYLQGYEGWAEWRRLDYPVLSPPSAAISGTGVPVRHGYSALLPTNNKEAYEAAVAAQGPDNQDTKLWWDTK